jgi:hypothetical protein
MVVVPYFGSKRSRHLAAEHEIFRNGRGRNKISCHAVVMTYESALSDLNLFSKLDIWPYLIVDEAQRLKNNASLLFKKLAEIKTDNRILLTGNKIKVQIKAIRDQGNSPSSYLRYAFAEQYRRTYQHHELHRPFDLQGRDTIIK